MRELTRGRIEVLFVCVLLLLQRGPRRDAARSIIAVMIYVRRVIDVRIVHIGVMDDRRVDVCVRRVVAERSAGPLAAEEATCGPQ